MSIPFLFGSIVRLCCCVQFSLSVTAPFSAKERSMINELRLEDIGAERYAEIMELTFAASNTVTQQTRQFHHILQTTMTVVLIVTDTSLNDLPPPTLCQCVQFTTHTARRVQWTT